MSIRHGDQKVYAVRGRVASGYDYPSVMDNVEQAGLEDVVRNEEIRIFTGRALLNVMEAIRNVEGVSSLVLGRDGHVPLTE